MASLAAIESILGGIPKEQKAAILEAFREVVKNGIRFGRPGDAEPGENVSAHFYSGTTSSNSGEEFTIAHSFGRAPYLGIPILDLQRVGSEIVPLQVTRAADMHRVYLASSEVDVPIVVLVEG